MSIGVYGLGRFGFFWAKLLSRYFNVKGFSRNPEREAPPGVKRVDEHELLDQNVIFLCVSISAMEEVLRRIGGRLKPDTLIIDTCSVKVYPAGLMEEILPGNVRIIASHPMFGPDSARDGLNGLPMIMWPLRNSDREFDFWSDFFKGIGLKVLKMDPDSHDREAAFTQGITHYIGRVIADLDLKESEIATVGYRKLLEIVAQTCNDPWQLFIDLQHFNPYTAIMREKLHSSIDRIMKKLDSL